VTRQAGLPTCALKMSRVPVTRRLRKRERSGSEVNRERRTLANRTCVYNITRDHQQYCR
jgi:hypothetical protein